MQLKSAVGIDYTRLWDLLTAGKWKEADAETARVMLSVAKRQQEGWLDVEHIDKFPGVDLCTIDQLWVKYSNERFGFSVQKRVYQNLGGTREYNEEIYEAFGDFVGWRKDGWIDYTDFTFTLKAPIAHLPVCWLRRGGLGAFFSCVETCYLPNPTFTIQNPKLPKLDDVELISAVGIDYSRLWDLLAAGKWKLANQETERVMFIVAKREEEGWLRVQDIDNFPCEDLRTINQLWVEHSNGRFGFSVQKQIYQGLGGSRTHSFEIWDGFGEAVGWKNRGGLWRCEWVNYNTITFDIKAPKGHLPVWKWTLYIHSVDTFNSLYSGGVDWGNGHGWDWISSLASRLVNCKI
ncbi:GUN4 domain-containing protein [Nostoc sp.]|uniref:GUN4 domain-containing protein n=1 Tax=Nostoc sp. TaxID=1180 RepID=UPI002FF992D8